MMRSLVNVLAVALAAWALGVWALFVGGLISDRIIDEIRSSRVVGAT